jgi:hypothetical protein
MNVMAGLVPATHTRSRINPSAASAAANLQTSAFVDGRHKAGHDVQKLGESRAA